MADLVITLWADNGWLVITDSLGHKTRYLWYPKREALRRFRREHGLRYKHATIEDLTGRK